MFENKDELLVQDNLGARPARTDGRLVAGALQFYEISGLWICEIKVPTIRGTQYLSIKAPS